LRNCASSPGSRAGVGIELIRISCARLRRLRNCAISPASRAGEQSSRKAPNS
jgi:hypothetical protein